MIGSVGTDVLEPSAPRGSIRKAVFWVMTCLLVILLAWLYYHILIRLAYDWWTDPNVSHGILVPVFSAWVAWHNRRKLAALTVAPSWWGLVVIAAALGVLTVGELGAEFFLSRTSFVFVIAGLIIYFLGWQYFRALAFPWAFLFLMIPIPAIIFNQIAFPLQFLAARLASSLLVLFGVPVLREGNVLQLPTNSLEVAEACSGIRSLMSLGALAIIYGYFLETKNLRRVLLALAAVPIAVVANGIRVMGTGLLGYYWDPDKAEGFFHTFSGWVIFVVSIALLFAFHGAMRWIRISPQRSRSVGG